MTASGTARSTKMGRAGPLCAGRTGVNLFGYLDRVVHLDPEMAHGALNFRVAEQQLHSA